MNILSLQLDINSMKTCTSSMSSKINKFSLLHHKICAPCRKCMLTTTWNLLLLLLLFCFFGAALLAYGGSQARGLIGTTAAGLHHNHRNTRFEPCLQPTPCSWRCQILNPLSKAKDQTWNLMVPSRIHFRCATMGTPFFLLTCEHSSAYSVGLHSGKTNWFTTLNKQHSVRR